MPSFGAIAEAVSELLPDDARHADDVIAEARRLLPRSWDNMGLSTIHY